MHDDGSAEKQKGLLDVRLWSADYVVMDETSKKKPLMFGNWLCFLQSTRIYTRRQIMICNSILVDETSK
jgi:hypothetical protein